MSALPPIRKLYVEDYASQKAWISPLLTILNQFMNSVVESLTRGLTIVDNTTSDIKTVTLSAVPSATSPASVLWTKPIPPHAVLVGNVALVSGAAVTLSSAVQVLFQMAPSGTALQITGLAGLTPTTTNQYILTLICIAG